MIKFLNTGSFRSKLGLFRYKKFYIMQSVIRSVRAREKLLTLIYNIFKTVAFNAASWNSPKLSVLLVLMLDKIL